MANLYRQITEDEGEFYLGSMNLFRQQIGNSISEIRTHYMYNDTLNIIQSKTTPHLAVIRDSLLTHLEEDSFLYKTKVLSGSSLISAGVDGPSLPSFVVLMDSLALAMDFEISPRPSAVQCDILLAICGQPVIVLTLVDGDKDSETVTIYNASVTKGVSSTLCKFMDEIVNVVFGVLCRSDLDTLDTFRTSIQAIAQDSSLNVPLNTLETSPSKYEKIVTAFWAGVAETDATLLVCEPQKKNRLGSVFYNITTDADLSDLSTYTNIVDETRAVSGQGRGRFWRFTKYVNPEIEELQNRVKMFEKEADNKNKELMDLDEAIDDISGARRRDTRRCLVHQLSHLQYGVLTQRRLLDIVRDVNTAQSDYLERASYVVETKSRKQSGLVAFPRYWETHSRVQVKGPVSRRWILEMAVNREGEVDRWIPFWSVYVGDCGEHPGHICTKVWGEGYLVGECLTDTMSPTPGTDVTLIYGAVLDIGRGRLAFIDVNRGRVLHKFNQDIRESLFPMFSAAPFDDSQCDVAMRLVSGREIAMTDEKKSLIATALYSQ